MLNWNLNAIYSLPWGWRWGILILSHARGESPGMYYLTCKSSPKNIWKSKGLMKDSHIFSFLLKLMTSIIWAGQRNGHPCQLIDNSGDNPKKLHLQSISCYILHPIWYMCNPYNIWSVWLCSDNTFMIHWWQVCHGCV